MTSSSRKIKQMYQFKNICNFEKRTTTCRDKTAASQVNSIIFGQNNFQYPVIIFRKIQKINGGKNPKIVVYENVGNCNFQTLSYQT